MNKVEILGVGFHNVTMTEAVERIKEFLDGTETRCVYTPNPEIVMLAQKDQEFMKVLRKGDLIVPDGIGVVKAAKMLRTPLKERVAGYDLVQHTLEYCSKTGKKVFFFGAGPGVADEAVSKMKEKWPGLVVCGTRNGYFKQEEEPTILAEIKGAQPDVVLVALGAPKQEKWIYKNRKTIGCKVCIGVGGSFDTMSGKLKRAPNWAIKLNLEWLYRFMKQPTRFKRFLQLPKFVLKVLLTKNKRRK